MIAKGASGGHGRLVRKSSHGAVITVLLKLEKGNNKGITCFEFCVFRKLLLKLSYDIK